MLRISLGVFALTLYLANSDRVRCQTAQPTRARTIILELRDGITGWPIWRESPNIRVGANGGGSNPMTDWKGQVRVSIERGGPQEVYVLPNWFFDCRFSSDVDSGAQIGYSVEQIVEHGIVSANKCGGRRVMPLPGVLILYVRARTPIEAFLL